ncbi:hypothetical protein MAR_013463 [Mya arenaria]|uniref:Uncharacterized protein n=1 Tax=Mya arenaria TaxID=6604 RepID=A0ABY7G2Y2_MYAAR|nr:hypothetical protein MAR_013463 [Mya arenaria]
MGIVLQGMTSSRSRWARIQKLQPRGATRILHSHAFQLQRICYHQRTIKFDKDSSLSEQYLHIISLAHMCVCCMDFDTSRNLLDENIVVMNEEMLQNRPNVVKGIGFEFILSAIASAKPDIRFDFMLSAKARDTCLSVFRATKLLQLLELKERQKPESDESKIIPSKLVEKTSGTDFLKCHLRSVCPDSAFVLRSTEKNTLTAMKFPQFGGRLLNNKSFTVVKRLKYPVSLWKGLAGWNVNGEKQAFVDHDCPVQHCERHGYSNGDVFDARKFKEIELNRLLLCDGQAKVSRHSNQVWIMLALESLEASPSYAGLNDVINWNGPGSSLCCCT